MNKKQDSLNAIPIYGIPTIYADEVWEKAEPIIQRAVWDDTDETIASVYSEVISGNYHLWIIGEFEAVAITEIQDRPERRVAWIRFIAGENMDRWFDAWIAALEHYAQNEDCYAIEFAGRKGWLKHAEKYRDYKPLRTIFRRVL